MYSCEFDGLKSIMSKLLGESEVLVEFMNMSESNNKFNKLKNKSFWHLFFCCLQSFENVVQVFEFPAH